MCIFSCNGTLPMDLKAIKASAVASESNHMVMDFEDGFLATPWLEASSVHLQVTHPGCMITAVLLVVWCL